MVAASVAQSRFPAHPLVNGRPEDSLSALSRGLAYGDGVFETLLCSEGQAVWLDEHLARLHRGCQRLNLAPDIAQIAQEVADLAGALAATAVIKIIVARRAGGRGYTPASAECDRVIAAFPAPETRGQWQHGVRVEVCQQRLAPQPALAGIKHLNRLEQVLAALELGKRGLDEGLMLDASSAVIEGTRSNVFIASGATVATPSLRECGIAGIMRQRILDAFSQDGRAVKVGRISVTDLLNADEVWLCNSVFGIWPVTAIGCASKPVGAITRQLQAQFSGVFHV